MPRLNKFIFDMHSFISLKNQIYLPSNQDIQYTFKDFKYGQIISYVDYLFEVQQGQCHVYSYPYTSKYYNFITNHFPGGLFPCVREIKLYDEYPFEHEFFLRIQKSFPLMEKLTLKNNKQQYRKSNEDTEHLSIIEYSHLTNLMLYDVHYDYIEQFLSDTRTCLTNGVCLRVKYKSLKKVTRNFTRNAIRINCNKINRLHIAENFIILND